MLWGCWVERTKALPPALSTAWLFFICRRIAWFRKDSSASGLIEKNGDGIMLPLLEYPNGFPLPTVPPVMAGWFHGSGAMFHRVPVGFCPCGWCRMRIDRG